MINVNIKAMHILFKKMVIKMKKQGYGRILNVASSAGLLPAGPYMATYYAKSKKQPKGYGFNDHSSPFR